MGDFVCTRIRTAAADLSLRAKRLLFVTGTLLVAAGQFSDFYHMKKYLSAADMLPGFAEKNFAVAAVITGILLFVLGILLEFKKQQNRRKKNAADITKAAAEKLEAAARLQSEVREMNHELANYLSVGGEMCREQVLKYCDDVLMSIEEGKEKEPKMDRENEDVKKR